jgi:PKD repeat protein
MPSSRVEGNSSARQRLNSFMLICLLLSACNSTAQHPSTDESPRDLLVTQFAAELQRLGVDPSKVVASAPAAGSEVFDLQATSGSGITLVWTERLRGDYDQNGVTNVSDLTPLGGNLGRQVVYAAAEDHGGQKSWPAGDPHDAGGAASGEAPESGSGAENWRLARVDGDSNGLINIGDLTPLGGSLGQQLSGYLIYRKDPGESDWTKLPNQNDAEAPVTIGRPATELQRPVRYVFTDPGGSRQTLYRIAPFDTSTNGEGPSSVVVSAENGVVGTAPTAVLVADVTQGSAPLTVTFDSADSFDEDGSIVLYELDFEGDGQFDITQASPITITHIFDEQGQYFARLRVSDDMGLTGIVTVNLQAAQAPEASLTASVSGGEVPLEVSFDASGSVDPGNDTLLYRWDIDGSGDFAIDTGVEPHLTTVLEGTGTWVVAVRVQNLVGLTDDATISLELRDQYDEQEPNASSQQASSLGLIGLGDGVSGYRASLGNPGFDGGTTDWFSFEASGGQLIGIGATYSSLIDTIQMRLLDSQGRFVAEGELQPNATVLPLHMVKSGKYYLRAIRTNPGLGTGIDYLLNLQPTPLPLDEIEPNNSLDQRQLIQVAGQTLGVLPAGIPLVLYGHLGAGDPEDWWSVLAPDQLIQHRLRVTLTFAHSDSDLDIYAWNCLPSQQDPAFGVFHASTSVDDDEDMDLRLVPLPDYVPEFQECRLQITSFNSQDAYYSLSLQLQPDV